MAKKNIRMPKYRFGDYVIVKSNGETPEGKFYGGECGTIIGFMDIDDKFEYNIDLDNNGTALVQESELEIIYIDEDLECMCDDCKRELGLADDEIEVEEGFGYIRDFCKRNSRMLKEYIKEGMDKDGWAKDMRICMDLLYDFLSDDDKE